MFDDEDGSRRVDSRRQEGEYGGDVAQFGGVAHRHPADQLVIQHQHGGQKHHSWNEWMNEWMNERTNK